MEEHTEVFANRVVKKLCGPKRKEVTEENYRKSRPECLMSLTHVYQAHRHTKSNIVMCTLRYVSVFKIFFM